MLVMTDEETRDAAAVMRYAENDGEWPTWHPNDGTQYRVQVVRCIGGPVHGDRMLLVAVTGQWCTVRYTPLGVVGHEVLVTGASMR